MLDADGGGGPAYRSSHMYTTGNLLSDPRLRRGPALSSVRAQDAPRPNPSLPALAHPLFYLCAAAAAQAPRPLLHICVAHHYWPSLR